MRVTPVIHDVVMDNAEAVTDHGTDTEMEGVNPVPLGSINS